MAFRRNVVILFFLVLLGAGALVGPGASLAYNLTGRWYSPLPPERNGTTVELTQSGNTIRWSGGPNDRAWLQEFNGSLNGNVFSGEFSQHAPGEAQIYRGSLSAQVINECEFRTLHVVQPGQADAGGATFTKTPCPPPPAGHYNFGFRLATRSLDLSAGDHGSFTTTGQPDTSGTVAISSLSAKPFKVTWRSHRKHWWVTFAFTGRGTYRPAGGVLDLNLVVKGSNAGQCRSGGPTHDIKIEPELVDMSLCREDFTFGVPDHATEWVKAR
jgi:hypothetical protein